MQQYVRSGGETTSQATAHAIDSGAKAVTRTDELILLEGKAAKPTAKGGWAANSSVPEEFEDVYKYEPGFPDLREKVQNLADGTVLNPDVATYAGVIANREIQPGEQIFRVFGPEGTTHGVPVGRSYASGRPGGNSFWGLNDIPANANDWRQGSAVLDEWNHDGFIVIGTILPGHSMPACTGLIAEQAGKTLGAQYLKGGAKQARGRTLDYLDAVVFYPNGETQMTPDQKRDLLTFVHEDGKGFVAVHSATASFYTWPEYGEMVGGYFENHPWNVFDATVIVERPDFPAMKHLPHEFVMHDEMYQYRAPYSRTQVDVLASLDASKLDLRNPGVKRTDQDFPIAWIKNYGKGRVFSSTLGHPDASWDDPRVQTIYLEGIKWVLRLTNGEVRPHPAR